MLSNNDAWYQSSEGREFHAIWYTAICAVDLAVQQLAHRGANRQAAHLAGYSGSISAAAERHLNTLVEPVNGHGKDSITEAACFPPQTQASNVNGHGTNAAVTSGAANEIGATCAAVILSGERPGEVAADTATLVERVETRLQVFSVQRKAYAADPQTWEVAFKFLQAALAYALRGMSAESEKYMSNADNVLSGGNVR